MGKKKREKSYTANPTGDAAITGDASIGLAWARFLKIVVPIALTVIVMIIGHLEYRIWDLNRDFGRDLGALARQVSKIEGSLETLLRRQKAESLGLKNPIIEEVKLQQGTRINIERIAPPAKAEIQVLGVRAGYILLRIHNVVIDGITFEDSVLEIPATPGTVVPARTKTGVALLIAVLERPRPDVAVVAIGTRESSRRPS